MRASRPSGLACFRRQFWDHIKGGMSASEAGVAVGVSELTDRRWFADAGGVRPKFPDESAPRKRPRLTLEERNEIQDGVAREESIQEMARQLKRAPSTIMREIERNALCRGRYRARHRFGAPWRGGWEPKPKYRASVAQSHATDRARRPKPGKLATDKRLHDEVQNRLDDKHSPEQVSHRLPVDFPDEPEMRVSHETIYQAIYVEGKGNLRRELHTCLRTGRALRKPQRRADERRGRIPDMISISERPDIDDRAVPGHWEGDLITGAENKTAIGTFVERMTRFTTVLYLPHSHGAVAVQEAIVAKMAALPSILRKTLTWDQGVEMTNHVAIAKATELDIYFCDPHSPWQRGTNENTNGLLRQYFAKGTDLSVFPADYLDYVAAQLNTRPRKTLGWKTPAEALDELLSNPPEPSAVAFKA
jgi:transposase, IS30 family